jgi:hypothetical protein
MIHSVLRFLYLVEIIPVNIDGFMDDHSDPFGGQRMLLAIPTGNRDEACVAGGDGWSPDLQFALCRSVPGNLATIVDGANIHEWRRYIPCLARSSYLLSSEDDCMCGCNLQTVATGVVSVSPHN